MFILDLIVAVAVGLIITAIFAAAFGARGPWGSIWLLLLVVVLAAWAGGLWLQPFGPTIFQIAWLPFVIVGFLFALILITVAPRRPRATIGTTEPDERIGATPGTVGILFWLLLIALIAAVILGYVF